MAGERNYHVFYMLCKAGADVRDPVHLTKWQDYEILNQKGTVAEGRYMHVYMLSPVRVRGRAYGCARGRAWPWTLSWMLTSMWACG